MCSFTEALATWFPHSSPRPRLLRQPSAHMPFLLRPKEIKYQTEVEKLTPYLMAPNYMWISSLGLSPREIYPGKQVRHKERRLIWRKISHHFLGRKMCCFCWPGPPALTALHLWTEIKPSRQYQCSHIRSNKKTNTHTKKPTNKQINQRHTTTLGHDQYYTFIKKPAIKTYVAFIIRESEKWKVLFLPRSEK